VFFTFFFPALLVVIFGALVRTDPTDGGLFAEPAGFYTAGYLAVVVLFTPLSRVGSEIARYRDGNRFEKLATTPLTRPEWLLAHAVVNVIVIGFACLTVLVLVVGLTDAGIPASPRVLAVGAFVGLGVVLFCGLGAVLGRVADSQDGVIAASNGIAFPLLFLSETFVPTSMFPGWVAPLVELSPLTYFARGVRALTYAGGSWLPELAVLSVLAAAFFLAGAAAVPRTD